MPEELERLSSFSGEQLNHVFSAVVTATECGLNTMEKLRYLIFTSLPSGKSSASLRLLFNDYDNRMSAFRNTCARLRNVCLEILDRTPKDQNMDSVHTDRIQLYLQKLAKIAQELQELQSKVNKEVVDKEDAISRIFKQKLATMGVMVASALAAFCSVAVIVAHLAPSSFVCPPAALGILAGVVIGGATLLLLSEPQRQALADIEREERKMKEALDLIAENLRNSKKGCESFDRFEAESTSGEILLTRRDIDEMVSMIMKMEESMEANDGYLLKVSFKDSSRSPYSPQIGLKTLMSCSNSHTISEIARGD